MATTAILSFVSFLDSHGAASWNLRYVAVVSGAILMAVHVLGKKVGPDGQKKINRGGVCWDGLLHGILSGVGSSLCLYLDFFAAEEISGSPEPMRSIRCEGPLTSLHRLLPAITWGYAMVDIVDSFTLGNDFLMHGTMLGAVMGTVCELGVPHTITPMLIMEVSTIPLNLTGATFLPQIAILVAQLMFAVLFFIIRILLVPLLWARWVKTFYEEEAIEKDNVCFPHWFIYVVLVFGVLFHSLNFYWFRKVVRKIKRKLVGEEKMTDGKME
uniref:TLC domain-containing protein n=1 Tax=Odontella aurita TaxID=265563 RepID=A0A7S4HND2_9STRA